MPLTGPPTTMRSRSRQWLACAAILVAASSNANAGASRESREAWLPTLATSTDEQRLLDDARDGQWNQYTLLSAALIASGATPTEQTQAIVNYQHLQLAFARAHAPHGSTRDCAAALLPFLHRAVFRHGYDLRATAIHSCLATGRFNCVSATVLFNCLAADAGLDVHTVGYPSHARSVIVVAGQPIEVETTCADWFCRPPHEAARDSDNYANLATVAHGVGRPLTNVQLVAMIYYNRAVEASRDHDHQAAIRLNRLALALDADHTLAHANLCSAINNQALAACHAAQFDSALALIRVGLSIKPDHRPFHENLVYVYHHWLEHLAGAHEINAALGVLDEARRAAPSAALWTNWRVRLASPL